MRDGTIEVVGRCQLRKWSMKVVDGVMSMVMMSVVEMVISYHSFLHVRYYFAFWIFRFLLLLVYGYGRYRIFFLSLFLVFIAF